MLLGGQLFPPHDIALLRPVQVVYGTMEQGQWYVTADTGDSGLGATWEAALENLAQTAPGTVFQGTVGYVILQEHTPVEPVLEDGNLSPNCGLCLGRGTPELGQVGDFLRTHGTLPTLGQLRDNRERPVPVLTQEESGYALTQP